MLTINTSGTTSAPIIFEAAPGQMPVIGNTGAKDDIAASNVIIKGFTVQSDASSLNATTAAAEGSSLDSGNGIFVGDSSSNHPTNAAVEGNTVHPVQFRA